ncbi:hypothetical protein C8F01DRAFT_1165710 [Mycena amicta]|nr:hypothetical protein C8F01DRAFT_1165710 [Mycena amicta]
MSPFSHIDASPVHLIVEQHATKATIDLVDGPTASLSSTPPKRRLRLCKFLVGLILVPGFSFIVGTLWFLDPRQTPRNPLPPPPPPPPLLLPQQGPRSDVIARLAQDLAAKRTAFAHTAASRGIQLPLPPPVKGLRAELAYALAMRKTRVWLETQKRRVQRVAAGQQMMARLARAPKVSKTANQTVPA